MHWSFQPPQDPAGIAKEASRKLENWTLFILAVELRVVGHPFLRCSAIPVRRTQLPGLGVLWAGHAGGHRGTRGGEGGERRGGHHRGRGGVGQDDGPQLFGP